MRTNSRKNQSRGKRLASVLAGACLFLPAALSASEIYVAPDGVGPGTKMSPASLQAALDAANAAAGDHVVFLREGAYDAAVAGGFKIVAVGNAADKSITLSGGWDDAYATQSGDAAVTVLDGHATTRVLSVLADGGTIPLRFQVENLTIQRGYAFTESGAGIRADLAAGGGFLDLYVRHCRLIDNHTRRLPSAPYSGGHGGGIYSAVRTEVVDTLFQGNSSDYHGAAINFTYRAPSYTRTVPVRVENSTFLDNYNVGCCPNGSAIMNFAALTVTESYFHGQSGSGSPIHTHTGSSLDLSNSVFEGNMILYWGSAVQFWDSDGVITNVAFVNNRAGLGTDGYGAVTYYNATGAPENVTITNSTFAGNRSLSSGNGVGGALHGRGANLTLTNVIAWDNGPRGIVNELGNASISYSDVQGGLASTGFSDGGNNIDANPQFVSSSDLRLGTPDSPCVDSGDNAAPGLPATDLDGKPRILNGKGSADLRVDMGAYELATFMCEPDKATIGTRMALLGKGYGTKKPSVFVTYETKPGKIKKVSAKVASADAYDTALVAWWTKKILPGAYDLWVLAKSKGATAVPLGHLEIMAPTIEAMPKSGTVGTSIDLRGTFFTSKKPKVYLRDPASGKKKSCKIVQWTMDEATGESALQLVVPKLAPKVYELTLSTGIGSTTPLPFEVEVPPMPMP